MNIIIHQEVSKPETRVLTQIPIEYLTKEIQDDINKYCPENKGIFIDGKGYIYCHINPNSRYPYTRLTVE